MRLAKSFSYYLNKEKYTLQLKSLFPVLQKDCLFSLFGDLYIMNHNIVHSVRGCLYIAKYRFDISWKVDPFSPYRRNPNVTFCKIKAVLDISTVHIQISILSLPQS